MDKPLPLFCAQILIGYFNEKISTTNDFETYIDLNKHFLSVLYSQTPC